MFPLPFFYYFEFAALVTSVLFFKSFTIKILRWFPFYLFLIISVELTARYIRTILHQPNVWVYNCSIPIEYLFYGFVYYTSFEKKQNRLIAKWFLISFAVFVFFNIIFIQGLGKYNSNVVLAGSCCMIILSGLMLFEVYSYVQHIWTYPLFWIATGVLFFNAGEFTYDLLSNFLINSGIDEAAAFFATINHKLILVLYLCLTISFICGRNTRILKKD